MNRPKYGRFETYWPIVARKTYVLQAQNLRTIFKATLTGPFEYGTVEGLVNKVKLLKRTMYGRASFALQRQRVLHAL